VIEAGRWTATARNTQGVSYIILQKNIGMCEKMAVAGFRKMKNVLQKIYKPLEKMEITDDFFSSERRLRFWSCPIIRLTQDWRQQT